MALRTNAMSAEEDAMAKLFASIDVDGNRYFYFCILYWVGYFSVLLIRYFEYYSLYTVMSYSTTSFSHIYSSTGPFLAHFV